MPDHSFVIAITIRPIKRRDPQKVIAIRSLRVMNDAVLHVNAKSNGQLGHQLLNTHFVLLPWPFLSFGCVVQCVGTL